MKRFYLGAGWGRFMHHPLLADVRLTISRRTLADRKTQPRREQGLWSLDSGAFSELSLYGRWALGQGEFVAQVQRIITGVGSAPEWVGPRDWMCEPAILEKTGLSVQAHQALTCEDYVGLRERAPGVPWLPVLQGWSLPEYLHHIRLYEDWGVCLQDAPLVGVGTVCRRQATAEISAMLRELGRTGIKLHGFGVKLSGMTRPGVLDALESADSMAWSYHSRKQGRELGHNWCGSTAHKNCATCPEYARYWYDLALSRMDRVDGAHQLALPA